MAVKGSAVHKNNNPTLISP